jgi:hypothetical protein
MDSPKPPGSLVRSVFAWRPLAGFAAAADLPTAVRRAVPSIVALIVMGTVLVFISDAFSGLVRPDLLNLWLAYMAGCVAFLSGTFILSIVPRIRRARGRLFWVRMGQVSSIGFCIGRQPTMCCAS